MKEEALLLDQLDSKNKFQPNVYTLWYLFCGSLGKDIIYHLNLIQMHTYFLKKKEFKHS